MASIVLLPSSFSTVREYACTSAESVGDCVSLYGGSDSGLPIATKTNISAPPWRRSIGVISRKLSSTRCIVVESGLMEGVYSALDTGREYGVGSDSRLSLALPTYPPSGAQLLMHMGVARSPSIFEIRPNAIGVRHA